MPLRKVLFIVPLFSLLYQAVEAHANYIQWSATYTETSVAAANGGALSGGITFTPPATTTMTSVTSINVATLSTSTTATSANPDLFNAVPYGIRIVLTDLGDPYHDSHTFIFTGTISGSLSTTSANLSNTFTSPSTQFAVFDRPNNYYAEYLLSLTSFTAPTPGGAPGNITLQVTYNSASPPYPAPGNSPEPASLVLAGLGVTAFGLARWRRSAARAAGV